MTNMSATIQESEKKKRDDWEQLAKSLAEMIGKESLIHHTSDGRPMVVMWNKGDPHPLPSLVTSPSNPHGLSFRDGPEAAGGLRGGEL